MGLLPCVRASLLATIGLMAGACSFLGMQSPQNLLTLLVTDLEVTEAVERRSGKSSPLRKRTKIGSFGGLCHPSIAENYELPYSCTNSCTGPLQLQAKLDKSAPSSYHEERPQVKRRCEAGTHVSTTLAGLAGLPCEEDKAQGYL